jgi:hypothetical protein
MAIHMLGPFRLDTQDELLFHGEEPVPLGGERSRCCVCSLSDLGRWFRRKP